MLGVDLLVIFPFFRKIVGGEDCGNWTDRHARATVDTLDRIDKQLVQRCEITLVFFRMDAIDRTRIDASRILDVDARFCDDVSHRSFYSLPQQDLSPADANDSIVSNA